MRVSYRVFAAQNPVSAVFRRLLGHNRDTPSQARGVVHTGWNPEAHDILRFRPMWHSCGAMPAIMPIRSTSDAARSQIRKSSNTSTLAQSTGGGNRTRTPRKARAFEAPENVTAIGTSGHKRAPGRAFWLRLPNPFSLSVSWDAMGYGTIAAQPAHTLPNTTRCSGHPCGPAFGRISRTAI